MTTTTAQTKAAPPTPDDETPPDDLELPQSAVEEDHRLDAAHERASERLAKHRWHWTLDESNPDRVSFSAYARAVGRNVSVIRASAKGYELWADRGVDQRAMPLVEAMRRATMTTEREAATEAVAKTKGTSFISTGELHRSEVRAVLAEAREVAEAKGTSITDEVADVALSREARRQGRRQATDPKAKAKRTKLALAAHHVQAMADELEGAKQAIDMLVEQAGPDADLAQDVVRLTHSLAKEQRMVRVMREHWQERRLRTPFVNVHPLDMPRHRAKSKAVVAEATEAVDTDCATIDAALESMLRRLPQLDAAGVTALRDRLPVFGERIIAIYGWAAPDAVLPTDDPLPAADEEVAA